MNYQPKKPLIDQVRKNTEQDTVLTQRKGNEIFFLEETRDENMSASLMEKIGSKTCSYKNGFGINTPGILSFFHQTVMLAPIIVHDLPVYITLSRYKCSTMLPMPNMKPGDKDEYLFDKTTPVFSITNEKGEDITKGKKVTPENIDNFFKELYEERVNLTKEVDISAPSLSRAAP